MTNTTTTDRTTTTTTPRAAQRPRRAALLALCVAAALAAVTASACDDDADTADRKDASSDTTQGNDTPSTPDTSADLDEETTAPDTTDDTDTAEDQAETVEPARDIVFPEGFLFGSAIAGFQVDMGCPTLAPELCNDTVSDWYVYTTHPDLVGDPSTHLSGQDVAEVGPGFWELYPLDLALARDQLHHNALRVSIEWSRIFPTATDGIDDHAELLAIANTAALDTYRDLFTKMRESGIEPIVTLNHYTLPVWIHDPVGCHQDLDTCSPRGWVDSERTIREIAKYSAFVAREFGDQVDIWATLNEPLQNMLFGYVQPNAERSHPPAAVFRLAEARIVLDALIEAHAAMYDAVKSADQVDADGDGDASFIGVVYPMAPMTPSNPNRALDVQATENLDYLWNRAFLRATALGLYDEHLDGNAVLREDLRGRMDYVGINWYFGFNVRGAVSSLFPEFSPLLTVDPLSLLNFGENEPARLPEMIHWVNDELGLPVLITENGDPVEGGADADASPFLVRNLAAVGQALEEGADVRGYMWWSLMDNFEWNHGMSMDFGLFAVDPADPSKSRTARPTAETYATIAEHGVLPGSLIDQYRQP